MINVEGTIISQYGESASITQLVKGIDHYLDPRADIELFIEQVWDIDTAVGWGLDVWGRIIGVDRYINVPGSGVFYIPDDDYRSFLFLKAALNISNCSAPSINRLVSTFFAPRGRVYVIDLGGMSMRYIFEAELTEWEEILFTTTEFFPKTTGVNVEFLRVSNYDTFFSFDGGSGKGFDTLTNPGTGGFFSTIIS